MHGAVSLDPFRAAAEAFQAANVYPHMAARDAAECVNALWVRTLHNDPNFRFATWEAAPRIRSVAKRSDNKRGRRGGGGGGGGGDNSGVVVGGLVRALAGLWGGAVLVE